MRKPEVSESEIRVHVERSLILFERPIVISGKVIHTPQICSDDHGKRIKCQCPVFFAEGFRVSPQHAEKSTVPVISFDAARIEIDSSLEFLSGPEPIPLEITVDHAQSSVRFSQGII